MIVVDSDVLIDALRGHEPSASRVVEGLEAHTLATTSISVFELLSGARDAGERELVATLLSAFPVLPFDAPASRASARLRRTLEAQGQAVGMADYQIAGICLARSVALMTRNRKQFERVPGLTLTDL